MLKVHMTYSQQNHVSKLGFCYEFFETDAHNLAVSIIVIIYNSNRQ
jgi:hypothetical protein